MNKTKIKIIIFLFLFIFFQFNISFGEEKKELSIKETEKNYASKLNKIYLNIKIRNKIEEIHKKLTSKNPAKKIYIENNTLKLYFPYYYIEKYNSNYIYILRFEIVKYLLENNYNKWNKIVKPKIKEYSNGKVLLFKEKERKIDLIEKDLLKYQVLGGKYYFPKDKEKAHFLNILTSLKLKNIKIKNLNRYLKEKDIDFITNNFELIHLLNSGFLEVNSFRERRNIDKYYRYYNIKTAFSKIGEERYIFPGESFSFINSIDYDEFNGKKNYKEGATIIGNKEVKSYGGGLCGASTAIYQGILTNKGLKIEERRPHSWWSTNLYKANVNEKYVTTPGLDSTIYIYKKGGGLDLKFKNITNTPILLINKIIKKGNKIYEQNFTIGKKENTGKIFFIKKEEKCYYWNINGKIKKSCYKKIL